MDMQMETLMAGRTVRRMDVELADQRVEQTDGRKDEVCLDPWLVSRTDLQSVEKKAIV